VGRVLELEFAIVDRQAFDHLIALAIGVQYRNENHGFSLQMWESAWQT